jgi:hypothetical protein
MAQPRRSSFPKQNSAGYRNVMALVALGALVATAQAENQTQSSDRFRAVKKQTVSQTTRPSQTVGAAATCTGMKAVCLSLEDLWVRLYTSDRFYGGTLEGARSYNEKVCSFHWEQCMKTRWWEGIFNTAQPNAVKS